MGPTSRQQEYLLYLAIRSGFDRTLTGLSEHFGVTKASAFSVLEGLEHQGMVFKDKNGVLELTESGTTWANPYMEHTHTIARWLESVVGMEPRLAEQSASVITIQLPKEASETFARFCSVKFIGICQQNEVAPDLLFQTFGEGVYNAPFTVFKRDSTTVSMGDQGFQKPAQIVCWNGCSTLVLQPRLIYYKKRRGKQMRGTLDMLWYRQDDVWREALLDDEGQRHIPGSAIRLEDLSETVGKVRIRVRSTIGVIGMPESEADLILNISGIKKAEIPGGLHDSAAEQEESD
ncbi:MAG: hypothetical protein H6Q60_1556 [Oscillospiraceae bacterium]|nr:hypothetical protein [Oscillospiraceae bacterium]